MDDKIVKICVVFNAEQSTDNFCKKHRECKARNIKRVLKQFYNNKD